MKYIETFSFDPYFNLALEEYVFENLPKDDCYLILWQNSNTIVVGKYQNTLEEVNQEYVDKNGIKVVRRLSGGGAVYHDMGNLNFTFIVDKDKIEDFNFNIFVVPVCEALKKLGVSAEFNGRNDITINGKKFSGNSQYSKGDRIMHHGCIMLDSNIDVVSNALKVKEAKFKSNNAKSVRSRVTTINENAPRRISMDEFKSCLKKEILKNSDMEYKLNEKEISEIERIAKEKYSTWEWNYGHSRLFEMERTEKFDKGLVTVNLSSENGKIIDIKLSGDFFGNGDISDVENLLKGAALNEEILERLNKIDLNQYMNGIEKDDIARLIRG